jgi:hypothetical protein
VSRVQPATLIKDSPNNRYQTITSNIYIPIAPQEGDRTQPNIVIRLRPKCHVRHVSDLLFARGGYLQII